MDTLGYRMSTPDLKHFRDLLRTRTGIVLDASKGYLIQTRLALHLLPFFLCHRQKK